jgi:hypothetical protein
MDLEFTARAQKDLEALDGRTKAQARKQLALLRKQYPASLNPGEEIFRERDVWQGRINRNYRFYFGIVGNRYRILIIIPHPK